MTNPDGTTLPTDFLTSYDASDCSFPRNWIMLSDPGPSPSDVCFFNTSTHKSFSFDLTPYLHIYSLLRSFDFLFLLKHKITQGFALLNPFMKSITPLPSKIESYSAYAPKQLEDLICEDIWPLSGVFVTSSFTIVLHFEPYFLVWTKPGDQSWVYDELEVWSFSNLLLYKDRLLAFTFDKGLVQINLANEMPNQLQVEVVIPSNELPKLRKECYLVDCDEEIILVNLRHNDHCLESFETYKLDLNEKTYSRLPNLGNYSIFLGENRTFSISCEDLPQVPTNSIYLCELYNLENNCKRCQFCEPFLNPSSLLVEKLIKCCLRSHWNILSEDDE
ncbi:hypothetical protein LUZ61_017558 [Rhynchospora tenuis]|uniref:KIB1-4 beta-propeller domain-containing protein n=1 Tax=Rhynchospora tenuis TaxID=198213 RepID=A0AAD5Z7S5_9POAL|nr:hypothetical protein LUZ61_017558 [Rhynchospora tenuis]